MIPYRSSPLTFQPALDAYRLAIRDARAGVERQPEAVQAWWALAELQESYRDYLAADKTIRRLRELAPRRPDYAARHGDVLSALDWFDEALAAYDAALVLDRGNVQAKRGRDQSLIKLGRVSELDPARRDYSSMQLVRVDFTARELDGARFHKSQLREAIFGRSRLTAADFSEAFLYQSEFKAAMLRAARFDAMRSQGADFSDADLAGASFAGANLYGARLDRADLSAADFSDASLDNASLVQAKLTEVRFDGGQLFGADLSGTDLSGLDLAGIEMQGIRLRDARLVGTNLAGAYLAGPLRPYRTEEWLHGPGKVADLRGADLTGAVLDGTDLRFALFDCRTKWPSGFDPSTAMLIPVTSTDCPGPPTKTMLFERPGELRELPAKYGGNRPNGRPRGPELAQLDLAGIDLSGANLSGFRIWGDFRNATLRAVDLRYAGLDGGDFRGTDLTGSDLSETRLHNADFSSAKLTNTKLAGARYNERTRWPEGFDPQSHGAVPEPTRPPTRPVP